MKVYVVTVIFGKRFPSYDVIGVFKKKPTELQISQYGIEYSKRCEGGVSSVDWYEFEIEEDNQNERAKNTNT